MRYISNYTSIDIYEVITMRFNFISGAELHRLLRDLCGEIFLSARCQKVPHLQESSDVNNEVDFALPIR